MEMKIKVKNKEGRNYFYIKGSEKVEDHYEDRFKSINLYFISKDILENDTQIDVKDGFWSFDRKDNKDYVKLIIKDYEVISEQVTDVTYEDDDLPF